MDRTYKCLKPCPGQPWEAGKTYTVNDEMAKIFVDHGYLEVAPTELEVAVDRINKASEAREARTTAAVVDEVIKRLKAAGTFGGGSGRPTGPGIKVTADGDDKTKSFADQLRTICIAQVPDVAMMFQREDDGGPIGAQKRAADRLHKVYSSKFNTWESKAALAESSGVTGGYTVQPEYGQELLALAAEESIVRPYANVKTLPAKEALYPMLNQTGGTPTQGTNYAGGAYMSWGLEAQTIGETAEPNFKQVHVSTNELSGLALISKTLLDDSFLAMDAELRGVFSVAISYEEDFQFLQGNGTGKPLGVLNSNAKQTVTRTTASQFVLKDAATMMAKVLPRSRSRSVWIMESLLFSELVQLVDASGRVTYVPNVGTGYGEAKLATAQLVLFGRPVIFTEKLNVLGTSGDVLLADFGYYIVGDTGTLEIAVSDQYKFANRQIAFRIMKRVDGRPQLDAPFSQQNGNTVSPFVTM